MACTQCGSNAPCGCSSCMQDPALPCGCGPVNSVTPGGCCQSNVPATPAPFYACAPACPESHVQKIVLQQFFGSITVSDSWNVPACGMSAIVNVVGLRSINTGAYIWNSAYGYFEVTAFNSGTGQLTITNNCTAGNASAGTNVPACTEFTITVPPCDCSDSSQVCVAIDFTAPDVSDCIDITLTSTQGIQVSFLVQLGSGEYRVSAIKPNDIITICNDGDGIVPGTAVIAKNAAGAYQYCLQIIQSNPCDASPVTDGLVLVCDGAGLTKPLTGDVAGKVLTLLNAGSGDANYQTTNVRKFRDSVITSDPSVPFTLDHTATTHITQVSTYVFTTGDRPVDLVLNTVVTPTFAVHNGNSNVVAFTGGVEAQLNGAGYIVIGGSALQQFFTKVDGATSFQPVINVTHIFLNLAANTTHTIDTRYNLLWLGDNTASVVYQGIGQNTQFLGF